jgi:hypothetical protein
MTAISTLSMYSSVHVPTLQTRQIHQSVTLLPTATSTGNASAFYPLGPLASSDSIPSVTIFQTSGGDFLHGESGNHWGDFLGTRSAEGGKTGDTAWVNSISWKAKDIPASNSEHNVFFIIIIIIIIIILNLFSHTSY